MNTVKSLKKDYKLTNYGPYTKRRNYSSINVKYDIPKLLSIQTEKYEWFLEKGINQAFTEIYPIISSKKNLEIVYKGVRIERPAPNSVELQKEITLAKEKGTNLSTKIYANLALINNESGEIKESEVLFGNFPLMTDSGSFIINGSERVIVSQIIRSPGIYFENGISDQEDLLNTGKIIPDRGARISWEYKTNKANYMKLKIDKSKNVSATILMLALGFSKERIFELFGDADQLKLAIQRNKIDTKEDALVELHKVLKPGDRITNTSISDLLANLFFNSRRYDLTLTGRYKINDKLSLINRINNRILADDILDNDGNILFTKDTFITDKIALEIHNAFLNKLAPLTVLYDLNLDLYGSMENYGHINRANKVVIVKVYADNEKQKKVINVIANDPFETARTLTLTDLVATFSYYNNLINNIGVDDDIDNLSNRLIRHVGELLQNQFRIGLARIEKNARERMSAKEAQKITPKNITNIKPLVATIREFFNSSQLSQFMDQVNPLSEISNKRRITALGPGGLSRDTAKFEVRDVHYTHYGRICPIETPEGPNIGLINNLSIYARINKYGFLETPYRKVVKGKVTSEITFLSAFEEEPYLIIQGSTKLNDKHEIIADELVARTAKGEYRTIHKSEVNFIDISPKQIISVATAMIPFLSNDDANRALMGANMQRQALPLLQPRAPFVATGIECNIAANASSAIISKTDGIIEYVDANQVDVIDAKTKELSRYNFRALERSNQGTAITRSPIVKVGDHVKEGDVIVDGASMEKAEIALGQNVTVAFMTWNGFNYEDAIIMSERIVKEDVYTSVHIEEYKCEFRKTKVGEELQTSEIPNAAQYAKRNLALDGIITIGAEVKEGDVLVGKITPKGDEGLSVEERLVAAIFSEKSKNYKDTSLKVKHGEAGTVIDIKILSHANGDKLDDGVEKIVKVYIAQKRKLREGDKMAGRHGNKGVVSIIAPVEDMPHLEDGTPIDVLLNPLGVPSRMNIGQILETHLGMAAKALNVKFVTPVFEGVTNEQLKSIMADAGIPETGKFKLIDGKTGDYFDSKITVGVMYMMKLAHMVDDKIHSRSVGPYSLITQQPLGGKSQNGGQRLGEMEVWALEGYGASHILQEMLTYKSDDIQGRNLLYNAIAKGTALPHPSLPESFRVLINELKGLGFKAGFITDKNKTIDLEGNEI